MFARDGFDKRSGLYETNGMEKEGQAIRRVWYGRGEQVISGYI